METSWQGMSKAFWSGLSMVQVVLPESSVAKLKLSFSENPLTLISPVHCPVIWAEAAIIATEAIKNRKIRFIEMRC